MRTETPVSRWLVIALCFLSQNMAIGFAFGSFGPLLVSTEAHFGISRSAATIGMSFMTLALGGLAPFLGGLMQRFPVRFAMLGGALLSAVGYFGLATLTVYPVALAMFVLIGAGMSLCGVIGPLTLVSRWFSKGRATALAVVNLPVALLLTPYIVGETLPELGRSTILTGAAAIFLMLAPLFLLLRDRPSVPASAQSDSGTGTVTGQAADLTITPPLSTREILAGRRFWLLSIAIGLMAGSGTIFVVHIVPFGIGQGMPIQSASTLLSFHAGAGLLGVLLFGRIADWIGPPYALVLTSFIQTLLWCGLLIVKEGPSLYLLSALMGMCAVPMMTLHGAALGALFPVSSISRAMGLSYAIKLPFLFTFAPGAALLFESSGSYAQPFASTAAFMAISCGLFLFIALPTSRQRKAAPSLG